MRLRDKARERTRERVLESADRCFRSAGFEATTIRQIAEQAGVSVGSVMAVGDKQALLVAVFDRDIARVHRGSRGAAPVDAAAASPVAEMLDLVKPFLDLFAADPGLSRRYAAALAAGEHDSEAFGGLGAELTREFGEMLERSGHSPERAVSRARVLHYAYLGVLFSSSGAASRPISTDTLSDELHAVFSTLLAPEEIAR